MLFDLENELQSKINAHEIKSEHLVKEINSLRKELAQAKKEFIDLYDYNSLAYFTIDKNYSIQSLNFAAAFILGTERKLLLHKVFLNYVTSNSKVTLEEKLQSVWENKFKQVFEIEIRAKGMKKKHAQIDAILLDKNYIRLSLIDTTRNHQLQNQNFELRKSINSINTLFQGASDALAALDKDLNIILINELFATKFSKIIAGKITNGMNLNRVLTDIPVLKSRILTACESAFEGKTTKILIENQIKHVDVYYCYELSIHSIYNEDNQKQELIFRIKNITDYKLEERMHLKQQSEIAQSSRLSTMGEMAAALAHEINQPLTAISAYSRSCILTLNGNYKEKQTKENLLTQLEKINDQSELAGEIIHNMKTFMREGHFTTEETDINQLIQETLTIFQYELFDYKLNITCHLMDDLPNIMTNKIHIMQVILNLARNSVEALRSIEEKNPELTIKTSQCDQFITVHIYDNGPGIPEEHREKILNNYFTTKRKGTGIGLGICRTLIEEHGGLLTLQPQNKKGAWFTFTLPIHLINLN